MNKPLDTGNVNPVAPTTPSTSHADQDPPRADRGTYKADGRDPAGDKAVKDGSSKQ